jgi:hypothetical protein
LDNSSWQLENGEKNNFWNHEWCCSSFSNLFNISLYLQQNLHSTMADYIVNSHSHILFELQFMSPTLMSHLEKTTIPFEQRDDKLLWKHSTSGELGLKDAYYFFVVSVQKLDWAKMIWNIVIPPQSLFLCEELFTVEYLLMIV